MALPNDKKKYTLGRGCEACKVFDPVFIVIVSVISLEYCICTTKISVLLCFQTRRNVPEKLFLEWKGYFDASLPLYPHEVTMLGINY